MSTKLVEIDGRPTPTKPSYAAGMTDGQFADYLNNAIYYRKHPDSFFWGWESFYGSTGFRDGIDKGKVLEELAHDLRFDLYLEDMVRLGRPKITPDFAGIVADKLAEKGDMLELRPTNSEGKPSEKPFPKIGSNLREGTIILRGDVQEATGVRGNGVLYIDGNVDTVACDAGITYVNGDVKHVENSGQGIVIITGKLGDVIMHRRLRGGLNLEVSHSPFVFATNSVKVEVPDAYQGRSVNLQYVPIIEPEPVYVVMPDRIRDWLPEDVRAKAMSLCVERLNAHFQRVIATAGQIKNPKDLSKFVAANLYGYIEGLSHGIYNSRPSIEV